MFLVSMVRSNHQKTKNDKQLQMLLKKYSTQSENRKCYGQIKEVNFTIQL